MEGATSSEQTDLSALTACLSGKETQLDAGDGEDPVQLIKKLEAMLADLCDE